MGKGFNDPSGGREWARREGFFTVALIVSWRGRAH